MLRIESKDRVLVAGQTGTGKSEWTKGLLGDLMAEGRRIVVIDVKDEYSVHGRVRAESSLGPLLDRWTAAQVQLEPDILESPDLCLAVVPEEPTSARSQFQQWGRAFKLVAELLRDYKLPCVLVLEEVQSWAKYQAELLEAVATVWRDYGVAVILVTQRAYGVPIDARSQLSTIVSFSQQEPGDIEALRERTALTDPTFADRVSRLSGRQFHTWRAGASNGEGKERRRPAVEAEPDQDGGDDHGGAVRPGEDQREHGRQQPDVQVREDRGAEVVAAPAITPTKKKSTRGGRRSGRSRQSNP